MESSNKSVKDFFTMFIDMKVKKATHSIIKKCFIFLVLRLDMMIDIECQMLFELCYCWTIAMFIETTKPIVPAFFAANWIGEIKVRVSRLK